MFFELIRLKKHRSQNLCFFFKRRSIYIGQIMVQISSKNVGHKTYSFFSKRRTCPRFKSEISDLFFVCFLVRLRVQFVRYISWIFPIFTVFRTNYSLNMLKNCGSQNRLFQTACGAPFASIAELR